MGCGGECGFCALLKFICCASWGFIWDVGGCGGDNTCSDTLVILGICLYVVQNSSGVSMIVLVLFWVCDIVVMPYV